MKVIEGIYCRIYSFIVMLILICKDKNTLYVYMWPHIGDVCNAMAYLKAYREQNNLNDITLLIKKQNYELCSSYIGTFEKVVFFNEKKLFKLSKSRFVIKFLKKIKVPIEKHFICTTPFLFDERLLHSEEITTGLITRRVIYNLKGEVKPEFPVMPKVDSDMYNEFCKNDKNVILSPYANSANEIKLSFWEDLSKVLVSKGYDVYTNATKDREVITGTKRLECSIIELLAYAEKADVCIALRSGMLDLIAGCSCKKIVIYNDYEFPELYNLSAWNNNSNLFQIYGEPSVEKVMELLS